ncbi:MAG TPA: hypothetical protein VFF30_03315 [Nitrososphaerales archaeon]|nr:hypothetical protein [Nitrososphaerales archaeon]
MNSSKKHDRQSLSKKSVLLLLLMVSVLALPAFVHTSTSAYTIVSTKGIYNVETYHLLDLVAPTPSYVVVNDTALANPLLGGHLPPTVSIVLSSSYNGGAAENILGCTAHTQLGGTLAECSFDIPFHGYGDYLLIGSVYGANGQLLGQTGIDPLIEPEW